MPTYPVDSITHPCPAALGRFQQVHGSRRLPRSLTFLLICVGLWLGWVLPVPAQPPEPEHQEDQPREPVPAAAVVKPLGIIDDRRIVSHLIATADQLLAQGEAVSMEKLLGQLDRNSCSLKLPRPSRRNLSSTKLLSECQPGILILGHLYQCRTCPRHHVRTSTGFVLTRTGAAVAAYHAVDSPDDLTVVAMTGDGRVTPVREVLAADEETDLAILQLAGSGFTPLPLAREDAPVGNAVRVISHPDGQHYVLTEGVLSRYFVYRKGSAEMTMMAITADFAKGSSGAPVLDEHGAVVGVANNTRSVYYNMERGRKDNLQMVFKHGVPSQYVRRLIHEP